MTRGLIATTIYFRLSVDTIAKRQTMALRGNNRRQAPLLILKKTVNKKRLRNAADLPVVTFAL